MKRIFAFIITLALFNTPIKAEPRNNRADEKPKIVVGLMVDQMRWDYLYKYQNRYVDGGFKRLLSQGFTCENTLIGHAPTVTACGHAAVYTGSVPAINGIVQNSWYDRSWGKEISNVADSVTHILGLDGDRAGRSPRNLLVTTIGDELKLSNHFQSKVVGVSLKDRGAILPAGHAADGAFWYEGGKFITSSYYMDKMPDWADKFNAVDWRQKLMPGGWNTLHPIDTYTLSTADDKDYESTLKGDDKAVFPYKNASIDDTPYGNTIVLEFAKAAIEGYKLGEGQFPDLLAVSLSSTDRIGHRVGPNAIEIEDTYLRLDRDLAEFFTYLDNKYGKDGYLFFITADHAVNQSPGFLEEMNMPTGVLEINNLRNRVGEALMKKYGSTKLVLSFAGGMVYLDYDEVDRLNLERAEVADFIASQLKREKGVENAFAGEAVQTTTLPERIKNMYINGYNPKRSGDVLIVMSSGWKSGSRNGATHGHWNPYDAHIPLVWMGHGIKPGYTHRTTAMADIAPTLAALLKIQMPSGTVGEVITEITDK